VEVMEMTHPKIALVADPKAEEFEELRRLASLVGDVVEAPSLQGALLETPDMVIILIDGPVQDWPESYPIPVVAVVRGEAQQVPPWARKVRLKDL
jgi:hypothetical protein